MLSKRDTIFLSLYGQIMSNNFDSPFDYAQGYNLRLRSGGKVVERSRNPVTALRLRFLGGCTSTKLSDRTSTPLSDHNTISPSTPLRGRLRGRLREQGG